MPASIEDLTGRAFGRLTVVALVWNKRGLAWFCACACGSSTVSTGTSLRSGASQSCGCLRRDVTRTRSSKHGCSRRGAVTGEYVAWQRMLSRCYRRKDPGYGRYGGRGIAVCSRWRKSFVVFLCDMGRRPTDQHTLGRIDNDRGYSPKNCRWETRVEQASNTSRSRHIEVAGVRDTISGWARRLGCQRATIADRLRRGWPEIDAVTTPAQGIGRSNRKATKEYKADGVVYYPNK